MGGHRPDWIREWEYPGRGTTERITDIESTQGTAPPLDTSAHRKLGEWASTAICGNDITSSCLYVTALAALYAGPYAPVSLLLVAILLYFFRNIYAEVGTALPLNGGAYNVLLNTTTKAQASVAACLTLLSYTATAVISSGEAMHYAHNLWGGLNIFWATVALLGLFAALNLIGIGESARVAVLLFAFHIATLTVLAVFMGIRVWHDPTLFTENWRHAPPEGAAQAIFFGFCAGLLGISGFESSANFIEEQQPGVFPKTLRNMWVAVAVFNPLISLLSLGLLPLSEIGGHTEDLLAHAGLLSGGPLLQKWVSIDAVLVLSGAVLTSYVGVTGLVRRMSLDRCLPQFLLQENPLRCTNHWIILLFFVLCCSILSITHGQVVILAGVYTLSFLGVMILFAIGNMLLKAKRSRLPRKVRASSLTVFLALTGVSLGLVGNVLLNPGYVKVFAAYFFITVAGVGLMFLRVPILKSLLFVSETAIERLHRFNTTVREQIIRQIRAINSQRVVYLTKGDNISLLNQAALYVLQNEQNKHLTVVHVYEREEAIPPQLDADLKTLDRIYPELRIDLLLVKGTFGPELIGKLSRRLRVPRNYMFISTPGDHFPHHMADLGGVRLIM